ncbi:MAG: hypothetical protein WBI44_10205, partial [Syntrophaceticus sp.]
SIDDFMKKGGVVAWGVVPTDGNALEREDLKSLKAQFHRYLQKLVGKGVDPQLLMTNSIITPACGAGTLNVDQAKRIYQLTAELARDWETNFSIK